MGTTRQTIKPYLEHIPDPGETDWNPCTQQGACTDCEIQERLSCMARNHSIYVVANMGNRLSCTGQGGCPADGQYQYNTNLAFDPEGKLVARYHKYNLFLNEPAYNTPTTVDYSFFDTPFGRLGTFICFDVIFQEPSITLIENYDIDTVVFPTAWMNVLPYFSGVSFHSGFAMGNGVNFLSSNLREPPRRFSGSGIYSSMGIQAYKHDESQEGVLMVAELESKPTKLQRQRVIFDDEKYRGLVPEFQSEIFGDIYNFVSLRHPKDEVSVCHKRLCCTFNYTSDDVTTTHELYALGAFDGLHTKEGTYYLQMCSLVKCGNTSFQSCGQQIKRADSLFQSFELIGNFTSQYVYPMVVLDEDQPAVGEWEYDGRQVSCGGTSKGLLSSTLFSRVFEDDPVVPNGAWGDGAVVYSLLIPLAAAMNAML